MSQKNSVRGALLQQCVAWVNQKQATIKEAINDLDDALESETKSTAGDKHETGRAMVQLEMEQLGNQLSEIERLRQTLNKINLDINSKSIGLGSVVKTSKHNYFISISAGEFNVDNVKYYAISMQTPIGLLLVGKSEGCEVTFRDETFLITTVM